MALFTTPQEQLRRYLDEADGTAAQGLLRYFSSRGGADVPMIMEGFVFLASAEEAMLKEAGIPQLMAREQAMKLALLLSVLPLPITMQKQLATLCLKLPGEQTEALMQSLHPALATAALLEAAQQRDLRAIHHLHAHMADQLTPMQLRELLHAILSLQCKRSECSDAVADTDLARQIQLTAWAFEALQPDDIEDPAIAQVLEGFLTPWNAYSLQVAQMLPPGRVLPHTVEQYRMQGQSPWVYATTLEVLLWLKPEYQHLWEVRDTAFERAQQLDSPTILLPLARRGDAQAIDGIIRQLFVDIERMQGKVRAADEKSLELAQLLGCIEEQLWKGEEFIHRLLDLVGEPLHMEHFGQGWEMQLITTAMEDALDWFVENKSAAASNILRLFTQYRSDIQLDVCADGTNVSQRPFSFEAFRLIARGELAKRHDPQYSAWGYLRRD